MRALPTSDRKLLSAAVLDARRASESACRAAIDGLGVFADKRPEHLDAVQAALRNGLRAKWRQLDGERELLIAECAYEQWHRLLFARFLAENNLLLHPQYEAPVTLTDCQDLAAELGEPDAWSVAARFASEILPGIFRLDDPCVRLRLAPEGRHALEQILDGLSGELFLADDALGWVYQFWQKDKKDEVNASERKIGGADLGPVTQLFTENYMVRFLLENSLGAWWAARHPDSPLVKGFEYLRFDDDGKPAAGSFDGWPERVAEVTVMDPCCGSGHFLVEAFSMLWQMRVEEEGLSPVEAQDAVLRHNLFGLEIDPRCVQIAMFAVAVRAWTSGGGWRLLPVPEIGCSGVSITIPVEEFAGLAHDDERIKSSLVRLHELFQCADTLGSLIDPSRVVEFSDPVDYQYSLDEASWEEVEDLLFAQASDYSNEGKFPEAIEAVAHDVARSAILLSRKYTLVVTNVPFLTSQNYAPELGSYLETWQFGARPNLGTAMISRILRMLESEGAVFLVCFSGWLSIGVYSDFRRHLLYSSDIRAIVRFKSNGFSSQLWDFGVGLFGLSLERSREPEFSYLDLEGKNGPEAVEEGLRTGDFAGLAVGQNFVGKELRFVSEALASFPPLSVYATSHLGLHVGDDTRFRRQFWDAPQNTSWRMFMTSPDGKGPYRGLDSMIYWPNEGRIHEENPDARVQGGAAWGHRGVAVRLTGDLPAGLYGGDLFSQNIAAIVPRNQSDLGPVWHFVRSGEYRRLVRVLDRSLKVTAGTLVKVPCDVNYWRVAAESRPLPEPHSDDPTQWLFDGRVGHSAAPLQVAVGRLLGYRWPAQLQVDDRDVFEDNDGIVSIPAVGGEARALDRVLQGLMAAYGDAWSPAKLKELLAQSGSKKKNLAEWLRDDFFKQHCALFHNRPFVWHIWDGLKDGFSALVNYHLLDHRMLAKLTYSYLGQDWVERQRAEVRDEVAGAEVRLTAALELKRKLELILDGEQPHDIYVRWKEMHEQPIGWEPDLNDGVRLNIRPFVTAGVLRSPFNIHWKKDRGKNPDGSERRNDLHLLLAEKTEARKRAGRT